MFTKEELQELIYEETNDLRDQITTLEEKVKALMNPDAGNPRDEELQTALEKDRAKDLAGGYEECGGLWGGFDDD